MIDYESLRHTMVESQLRPSGVTDRRLIAAMSALPRERFVPQARRPLAYADGDIEVWPSIDGAPARFLLAPAVLARLIQLAAVGSGDRVLDIGCATGYSTAVLARLARSVIGLEIEPELVATARRRLRELDNARIVAGALAEGHAAGGPYDVIFLNGSVPRLPESLTVQLKEEGRLVAVIRDEVPGKAYRFTKSEGRVSGVPHFDAEAKPLPGFASEPCFVF